MHVWHVAAMRVLHHLTPSRDDPLHVVTDAKSRNPFDSKDSTLLHFPATSQSVFDLASYPSLRPDIHSNHCWRTSSTSCNLCCSPRHHVVCEKSCSNSDLDHAPALNHPCAPHNPRAPCLFECPSQCAPFTKQRLSVPGH